MNQGTEKRSFGEMLRILRGQTRDRDTGRSLSQDKLAYLLTEKTGLTITRNKVNNWETGKNSPHPKDDRHILIAIVAVLHKYKGIMTLTEADQLLEAGDYRELDEKEIAGINKEWLPSPSDIKQKKGPGEKPSALQTALHQMDPATPFSISIGAENPIPISIRSQNAGPGSAPPVPSLIIGRDDDLQKLKENLGIVGKHEAAIQILTAIKGWPGVGKTTIASALAHDDDVQKAFPDGVLWISLGQEPNLLSEIATWGRALGTDELLRAKTLEEAQTQLAALLRNKRMLLIIDDVWRPEHAKPFKVGGRNCATLITTRRDDVANALAPAAANIYRLKVLNDEDALKLIRQLAPEVVNQYPDECLVLVKELEGLPLALQVAGRLLNAEANRGFGVVELINDLQAGSKLLEAAPPVDRIELVNETTPTIAALLQRSLDCLEEDAREYYAYLGAFAPKPATFDLDAMKFVWEVEDPKPIVGTMVDHGLLEYVKEFDRYQMHATLVMLAKSLLTND